SRADIEGGALAGRGLELAWVADPVALFVLHVQGSGRLRLDDGALVGARWAGSNGRPYRSVAQALGARGLLPDDHTTLPDGRGIGGRACGPLPRPGRGGRGTRRAHARARLPLSPAAALGPTASPTPPPAPARPAAPARSRSPGRIAATPSCTWP